MRLKKLVDIAARPALWRYAVRGVAPSVEHIGALGGLTIATCLDVGANVGQFSALVSYLFPTSAIIAFEPLPSACTRFRSTIKGANVQLFETALSNFSGTAELNITNRSDSSSLLVPGSRQEIAFGVTRKRSVTVAVNTLDELLAAGPPTRPVLLKIDVQGGELDVLKGAKVTLGAVDYCYVELSFVELYEGQPTAGEILSFLFSYGFRLGGVYNQATTATFGAVQADFLLYKAVRD